MMSMTHEIRILFDLASLRHEASHSLDADDWRAFREIRERHDDQRRNVETDFEQNHEQRIAKARRQVIAEAGGRRLELAPRWAAQDRFDKTAIDRRAQAIVQRDQREAMHRIAAEEARQIENLLDRADPERRARVSLAPTFDRAVITNTGAQQKIRRR